MTRQLVTGLGVALVALAVTEVSSAQTAVHGSVGYSFDAANYWGTGFETQEHSTSEDCAMSCDADPRCQVASFHDATAGAWANKCVLRSEPGARHPENHGVLSWVKAGTRSASGTPAGHCDLRKTDWGNMEYPGYVLKSGSMKGSDGIHADLLKKDIVYGDLRGDGSLLAFVPVFTGTVEGAVNIYVVDADPSCKLRLLMTTGGQPAGGPGKIVGPSYVFTREAAVGGEERVEVRWTGGRLMEPKVLGAAPPPAATHKAQAGPVAGAACERGRASLCVDDDTVAACDNGRWRLQDCRPATCFTGPTGMEPSCSGPPRASP